MPIQDLSPSTPLSLKLMQWVLAVALFVGLVLSTIQIIIDADSVINELKSQSEQTLAIVKDAATQAVYSIDPELGSQVIDGLFAQESIIRVRIAHPDNSVLAERTRLPAEHKARWLTDLIFEPQINYVVELNKTMYENVSYGRMEVTVDTAHATHLFVKRALFVFFSGVVKAVVLALVLYLVYHLFLTRPLTTIIRSLVKVDPSNPGNYTIDTPKNHNDDELGIWVKTANNLLSAIASTQKKRKDAEARALKLSRYDPLTGLPNRRLFINQAQSALHDAKQLNQRMAVICCGIDDFKLINEQTGYAIGDEILRQFADRLSKPKGVPLSTCRLGGDQFALILYNTPSAFSVANYADKLLAELEHPFEIEHHHISIHCTMGVTIFPDDDIDADKLLQKAEQTMLLAKTENRRHCQFYVANLDQEMRIKRQLEHDLMQAIDKQELFLVYQPQINYQNQSICGVEALIRWKHPNRGLVPPDVFIPIAENSSLILDIGNWVINAACRQAAEWKDSGIHLKVAINLSAVQTNAPSTRDTLFSAIKKYKLPGHMIEVEVTETGLMKNVETAIETLTAFKNEGIKIALDDFGTGYSSLSYLKRLPVDKLKIDKQFVNDLLQTSDDTHIVKAIIQLGKSMKLQVIAEGVENKQQEQYLMENGCQMGQGYFYSKPQSPEQLEEVFAKFGVTELSIP